MSQSHVSKVTKRVNSFTRCQQAIELGVTGIVGDLDSRRSTGLRLGLLGLRCGLAFLSQKISNRNLLLGRRLLERGLLLRLLLLLLLWLLRGECKWIVTAKRRWLRLNRLHLLLLLLIHHLLILSGSGLQFHLFKKSSSVPIPQLLRLTNPNLPASGTLPLAVPAFAAVGKSTGCSWCIAAAYTSCSDHPSQSVVAVERTGLVRWRPDSNHHQRVRSGSLLPAL